jgi:hypothetical protein
MPVVKLVGVVSVLSSGAFMACPISVGGPFYIVIPLFVIQAPIAHCQSSQSLH